MSRDEEEGNTRGNAYVVDIRTRHRDVDIIGIVVVHMDVSWPPRNVARYQRRLGGAEVRDKRPR